MQSNIYIIECLSGKRDVGIHIEGETPQALLQQDTEAAINLATAKRPVRVATRELDRGAQAHSRKPFLLVEELPLGVEHYITDAQGIVLTLNEHPIAPRYLIGKFSGNLVLPHEAFVSGVTRRSTSMMNSSRKPP